MVERRTVEHIYLSTACLHGEHGYCQAVAGRCGSKAPAVCKFCSAPCVCQCHAPESGRERSPAHPRVVGRVTCGRCQRVVGRTDDGLLDHHDAAENRYCDGSRTEKCGDWENCRCSHGCDIP